jgi:gas vesicle protein
MLEQKVTNLKETIEDRKGTIDTLKKDKEKKLSEKETLITQLKHNIDAMSSQFADMLKDTLNKMKTRIENANKQWEEENETNITQRFDEHMKLK